MGESVLLIDPTPEQLAAHALPYEVLATREGVARHATDGAAVAWWTDHGGRKRVRVTSGRAAREEAPPVWHVCPERIYRVSRGGVAEWVAACACGVVGAPGAIAWDGERCGACHDRAEEGETLERGSPQLHLLVRGQVDGLAFTPGGDRLALSTGERRIEVIRLSDGDVTLKEISEPEDVSCRFGPLAYSPCGKWLVWGDARDRYVMWTNPDWKGHVWGDQVENADVMSVAFDPRGRRFLVATGSDSMRRWTLSEGDWQKDEPLPGVCVTCAEYFPDGRRVLAGAAGPRRLLVLDAETFEVRREILLSSVVNDSVYRVKLVRETAVLLLGDDHAERPFVLTILDLANGAVQAALQLPSPCFADFTADGRYAAVVALGEGPPSADILMWDIGEWREAARIAWDIEDELTEVAFSPDNETLATSSRDGVVKLWPWRRLVEW